MIRRTFPLNLRLAESETNSHCSSPMMGHAQGEVTQARSESERRGGCQIAGCEAPDHVLHYGPVEKNPTMSITICAFAVAGGM
jgi:hypothetical protein